MFRTRDSTMQNSFVQEFDRFLQEKKLRRTPERFKILTEIKKIDRHFEADDLILHLQREKIIISRATVYRTLSLLEESNILRKFRFDENHFHYELHPKNSHHAHLVCVKCGTIIEFDDQELEELQARICREYRCLPVKRTVEIYGVCAKCRKKEN